MRTNSVGSVVDSAVKVEDFSQHVRNMHMHTDIAFGEEYEVMRLLFREVVCLFYGFLLYLENWCRIKELCILSKY